MWKWIVRWQKRLSVTPSVSELKVMWMEANGYKEDEILNDCFFCEYSNNQKGNNCTTCPGSLVSENFTCETNCVDWSIHPEKFYKKLLELNRKRKKK
jgi:hypothetical protein